MSPEQMRREVERLLDEAAARRPEGAKSDDLRHEILSDVAGLLADLDRDLFAEADALIVTVARQSRRARRGRMASDIDYILDAFAEDESAAYIDPMLDLAYPIGTEDGQVKTLRYWTADDFDTSTRMAYRKAAEVTASAREHDERMHRALMSMRLRGVERFGESA